MKQLVAVLGRGIVDASEPIVTADDAGLVRGDGCFDATLIGGDKRVWDVDEHLARFVRSCERLALPIPDVDAWQKLIDEAVAAWDGGEAALKIVTTRGPEHGGCPTAFLTITAVTQKLIAERDGIHVITLDRSYASDAFADAPWLLGGVKTLSYAINAAAKREASARSADDVIFTSSDGYVLEAPTAAVIWQRGDHFYSTPHGATGILGSISQAKVFRSLGGRADYRLGTPDDLLAADGIWLVSSVRGTAPLLSLDGRLVTHSAERTAFVRSLNGF